MDGLDDLTDTVAEAVVAKFKAGAIPPMTILEVLCIYSADAKTRKFVLHQVVCYQLS